MRIVLFGLTGFGNAALRGIRNSGFEPQLIVTRKETGDYPYYPEASIEEEARQSGIPVLFGAHGERETERLKPEVILASTYHRIMTRQVFESAKVALNIHPSLLPAYRGASPCYWVLQNGEKQTGVSVHYMTEEVDAGPLVWQKPIKIRKHETQGTLRKRLAALTEMAARDVLKQITRDKLSILKTAPLRPSWYPRVSLEVEAVAK